MALDIVVQQFSTLPPHDRSSRRKLLNAQKPLTAVNDDSRVTVGLPHAARVAVEMATIGCNNFPAGKVVIVEKVRPNTSIVHSDSLSGDGVMTEVIVANVDYEPYLPPHTVFFDTIRARCPDLLEGLAAEQPPRSAFIDSLPPPVRTSIGKTLDESCGSDDCLTRARATEIERRDLVDRWASFLCAHPNIAIEPNDQSNGQTRD